MVENDYKGLNDVNLSEVNRKYILLAFVGVIIFGIIGAKWIGSKQDEQFAYEDQLYNAALQYVNEGNAQEAATYVQELLKIQPDAEAVNYLAAIVYANTEDMAAAAVHMQKTLDINPYKVEDATFMLQFGEILFLSERYDDAKTVLTRCQEWGWAPEEYPEYQQRVQELLTAIEQV